MVWQKVERVTVSSGGGTETVTIPLTSLSNGLTIWALSNAREIDMTFQFQVNGVDFGLRERVTGVCADVVFTSGGAQTDNLMFPFISASDQAAPLNYDPCDLSLVVTNHDGSDGDITIAAVVR